jgi:single-strand DNA-binding protein
MAGVHRSARTVAGRRRLAVCCCSRPDRTTGEPGAESRSQTVNDTMITIVGNVVDAPRRRRTKNGHEVTNFRIASTSRRYDREQEKFIDNATLFVNVTCWRQMGVNVDRSLKKGQPVLVYGRYCMREYTVEEQVRTSYELEAIAVGHDLARGTTEFTRVYQTGANVTVVRDEEGVPKDESDHWLDLERDAPAPPVHGDEDEPEFATAS